MLFTGGSCCLIQLSAGAKHFPPSSQTGKREQRCAATQRQENILTVHLNTRVCTQCTHRLSSVCATHRSNIFQQSTLWIKLEINLFLFVTYMSLLVTWLRPVRSCVHSGSCTYARTHTHNPNQHSTPLAGMPTFRASCVQLIFVPASVCSGRQWENANVWDIQCGNCIVHTVCSCSMHVCVL